MVAELAGRTGGIPQTEAVACTLCELTTNFPLYDEAGDAFCCPACREVCALLAMPSSESQSATEHRAFALDLAGCEVAYLTLAGMWCPSCSWLIGETLQRTPGVAEANVSFLQREARVTYDPDQIDPRRITRRVRHLGYWAGLPGDKPFDDEEAFWNRLLVAGLLTMHIMLFSFFIYGRDWLGMSSPDTEWLVQFFNLISMVLALPVLVILGWPILRAGGASLLRGRPNIHTLIAIGAFSAFALSVFYLIAGNPRVYFDTAAVLLLLVSVGRWLEMQAQKRSTEAVERLQEKLPAQASVITADGEEKRLVDAVTPGMRIRVRPGERFPVDGIVATGQGDVDESLLTGEPEPVLRAECQRVMAGTFNLDGGFEVITSAVGSETVAGQIGRLLHQALWQRAPVERLADRLAALMVPVAITLAVLTFLFWSWFAGPETAFVHALSVLLIACPCALGIATPLTLWLGLGRAAESGAILRNTGVLEALAGVRHFFFDKTGTLSERTIRLQAVAVDSSDLGEAHFLAHVAALESQSEHPIGAAIAGTAKAMLAGGLQSKGTRDSSLGEQPIRTSQVDSLRMPERRSEVAAFRALPGSGVVGQVDGVPTWVGNRYLMNEAGLSLSPVLQEEAARWLAAGRTVVYAGWQGQVTGILGLGERMRDEAIKTVDQLRSLGVDITVLTGDENAAGLRWQARLDVPVFAEQMPEDKLRHLAEANGLIAMVGDGINDGPALAAATVGIAVNSGADVAQAAADVVLLGDDLATIPWLVQLSRRVMRTVRQNLSWAFAYNIIGLTLAMSGHLQPSIAALLMVLSSAVVIGNAMRLRRMEIDL